MTQQLRQETVNFPQPSSSSLRYAAAMERLVPVVQLLSDVRTLESIAEIVRHAARNLTDTDGATFVLRSGNECYYAEEDAISPLWKGQRFPLEKCISGWVMLNSEAVFIADIYKDKRIPHEAYRTTFVKSLMMVPIRHNNPIGAIGNYWAKPHEASLEEMRILQVLADITSLAIENVRLHEELQVSRKTA